MLEHLGRKGRSTKPKKEKPKIPTYKEEKDLLKDLHKSYANRGEDGEEVDPQLDAAMELFQKFEDFRSKPKSEIIRTLEACIEWLNANEEELNDAAVRLIDERLQSHAKKSQVFFVVAIQKRMESLLRIMEAVDLMEVRLLDPAVIWEMPPDELRKTLELMEKKSELILKQVAVMIENSGVLPKQFHDEQKLPTLKQGDTKVFTDVTKRDMLRSRLENLIQKKRDE